MEEGDFGNRPTWLRRKLLSKIRQAVEHQSGESKGRQRRNTAQVLSKIKKTKYKTNTGKGNEQGEGNLQICSSQKEV